MVVSLQIVRQCGIFFLVFVGGLALAEAPTYDKEGFCVITIAPTNPKVYVEQKTIDANLSPFDLHVMRIGSTKQTISSTQLCDEFDDVLVSKDAYFMTDYRDHDGMGFGYNVFHTKNGHQIVVKTTSNTHMEAGKDLGIKPFGIRAMNSLRVEKSYKLVGTELSIEYSPYESGLDRFIHPNKGNFIGLDALNKWREKGFDNKLVTLEVHDTTDSDVLGNNPIYKDDKVVGRATGGEYGFRLDKSIALAMVKPDLANVGEKLKVDILGKMYEATIVEESPYDAENKLLRA